MHSKRPTRRLPSRTSLDRPRISARLGYVRRENPASAYHEETLTQITSEIKPLPANVLEAVCNKSEVASLLRVPETWIATHANSIPGAFRLGRNLRFRRAVVEEWLGGAERVLDPKEVAEILHINVSWVYAHADQIPGVLRLGHYVRFKPSMLMAFLKEGSCQ